jgi:hypothetical protein
MNLSIHLLIEGSIVMKGKVSTVKLQKTSSGRVRYTLTVPRTVASLLDLEKGDLFDVHVNGKEIIYKKEEKR